MKESKKALRGGITFWITFVIMFCFWILLSWNFKPLSLFLAVVSSALVAWWSHDLLLGDVKLKATLKGVWEFIKYIPWLEWQIVLANVQLIKLIFSPMAKVDPQMIKFDTGLKTDIGKVILANSITLTPGTVTVEAGQEAFVVHALTNDFAKGVLAGDMQARVRKIEEAILNS